MNPSTPLETLWPNCDLQAVADVVLLFGVDTLTLVHPMFCSSRFVFEHLFFVLLLKTVLILHQSLNIHHSFFFFFLIFTGSKAFHFFFLFFLVVSVVVSFLKHLKIWISNAQPTSFFFPPFFLSSSLSDLLMPLRVSTEFERNGRLEGSRWGLRVPPSSNPHSHPDKTNRNVVFRLSSSAAS